MRFKHQALLLAVVAVTVAALVRALEGFEDHPEYGDRQLIEGGFRDGDLLVATRKGAWLFGSDRARDGRGSRRERTREPLYGRDRA